MIIHSYEPHRLGDVCYYNTFAPYSKYQNTHTHTHTHIAKYRYKLTISDIPGMCRGACRESQCECIEYVRKSDNTYVLHVDVSPII